MDGTQSLADHPDTEANDASLPTTTTGSQTGSSGGGLKLGVVHLGKICGKHKYMLLDAQDIPFVRRFSFRAKLDVDRNGNGARIYAYAFTPAEVVQESEEVQEGPFEELLWRHRHGSLSPGHRITHKNGITVDNRLSNLDVISEDEFYQIADRELTEREISQRMNEANLYRAALAQLPPFPEDEYIDSAQLITLNGNGEIMEEDSEQMLYECHYPPCHNIESHSRQFNICGRCRVSRYCGTRCQQLDWTHHKVTCKKRESKKDRFMASR
eukprot:Sdes_comp20371_c0_seq1m14202